MGERISPGAQHFGVGRSLGCCHPLSVMQQAVHRTVGRIAGCRQWRTRSRAVGLSSACAAFLAVAVCVSFAAASAAAQNAAALPAGTLVVTLVAPAQAPPPAGISSDEERYYRIGPSDVLRITVLNEPDLSVTVPVRPDGRFSMPLLADVQAAGKTPMQLRDNIAAGLSEYLQVPTVTVEVLVAEGAFNEQIRVVGTAPTPEVGGTGPGAVEERFDIQPRRIAYRQGITLLDVITELGGLSPVAAGNRAVIIRTVGDRQEEIPVRLNDLVEEGDITANVAMAPGDVLLIPQGALAGDWETAITGGVFLTYTDNVNLVPDNLANSALITTLTPGISIRGTTPRFFGGFDAILNIAYQSIFGENRFNTNEGLDVYLNPLVGTARVEAVPDVLFIDTSVSVSQQSNEIGDATSTSEFVQSNRTPQAAFTFSPYVPLRFGDYASGQVRYRFSGSFEGQSETNPFDAFINRSDQTLNNDLGMVLVSGPETSDYGVWTFTPFVSKELRSDEDDITRGRVEIEWAYPLNRQLFGLASFGWQYFDDGDPDNKINAPLFSVGTRWVPSPRLTLTATVGQQDERFNFFLDFRYEPTPRTNFYAVYREGIGTTASLVANNASFIAIDPETGAFINTLTGATFSPTFSGTFSTETQYIRNFTAGASTRQGRNVLALTASYLSEEDLPDGDVQETYNVFGSWSRPIRIDTAANIGLGYTRDDLDDRTDNTFRFLAGLSHQLYDQFAAVVNYGFQKRDSTLNGFDFTENTVTVGITGTF